MTAFRWLLDGLWVIDTLVLVVVAGGLFRFWARSRFWLPAYAHVLAGIGLVVGLACMWTSPDDAPVSHWDAPTRVLAALVVPAMVYFFFVFYGGQRAAFEARADLQRCARCGYVPNDVTGTRQRINDGSCARCGPVRT